MRTVLVQRTHAGPLRVQRPFYPEAPSVCHTIVVHPPAGLVGGDCLTLTVGVGPHAHALLTTPGAGKWYRSDGRQARLDQHFVLEEGAVCEWLPQESLVFDGAHGHQTTRVSLADRAIFVGSEMLALGRTASGERFDRGAFRLASRIERNGQPVWLERGLLEGGSAQLTHPAALAGAPVCATLVVAAENLDGALCDACRAQQPVAGQGAITRLPGLLIARWLGPACEPGREWLIRLWQLLRPRLLGQPACIPRIWHT